MIYVNVKDLLQVLEDRYPYIVGTVKRVIDESNDSEIAKVLINFEDTNREQEVSND